MWKLIAVGVLSSLGCLLTALPVDAYCTPAQVNQCNDQNNSCTNVCNFTGAPQPCYVACVCGYERCREGCGDGSPVNCPPSRPTELTAGGGEDLPAPLGIEVEVDASPEDSSALAQVLTGQTIPAPIEAATFPVCSHALCQNNPTQRCRCPSGTCQAGLNPSCRFWYTVCNCL